MRSPLKTSVLYCIIVMTLFYSMVFSCSQVSGCRRDLTLTETGELNEIKKSFALLASGHKLDRPHESAGHSRAQVSQLKLA